MRDDVAHATHLSVRQLGNPPARLIGQMDSGFTDDFDPADYGILLFGVGRETRLRYTYDEISCAEFRMSRSRPSWSASIDADRRIQNVLAREWIWRLFQRRAQDKINWRTD